MDLGLNGRVAVVAASSKGLGRGVAEALAAEGVSVVMNSRTRTELHDVVEEMRAKGAHVVAHPGDITDPHLPEGLVERAMEEFGRIDIVVSNAGGPPPSGSLDLSDADLSAALESSFLSHVRFVRAARPYFEENHWGRFCAIASFSIIQALPNLAASTTARSALRSVGEDRRAGTRRQGHHVEPRRAGPSPHGPDQEPR